MRRETQLLNPDTLQAYEVDLYLPSLSLAFEYQVSLSQRSTVVFFDLFQSSFSFLTTKGEPSLPRVRLHLQSYRVLFGTGRSKEGTGEAERTQFNHCALLVGRQDRKVKLYLLLM